MRLHEIDDILAEVLRRQRQLDRWGERPDTLLEKTAALARYAKGLHRSVFGPSAELVDAILHVDD